jgi:cytochrome c-type biogenesis protein CcmF
MTTVAVSIGVWACVASLLDPLGRLIRRSGPPLTRAHWGMCIAHFGIGVFLLGATVASVYNFETDVSMRAGDRFEARGYEIVLRSVRQVEGPNYVADEGEFELRKDGQLISVLTSQQRMYNVQRSAMTEAAIDARFTRDVFVALAQPLGDGAWSVRVQVKPLIRFIWFGALIMAIGGFVAITDRRYRGTVPTASTAPTPAAPAAERA